MSDLNEVTAEHVEFIGFPREDYAAIDGSLCRCGHYLKAHEPEGIDRCRGPVGDDLCTCLGFRASRKARR